MHKLLQVFLFFLMGSVLLMPAQSYAQQSAQITLAGYKHSPPVPTNGDGFVTVELNNDTLKVHGEFSDLTSWYSGAYIMVGEKGETGNQLFRLKGAVGDKRTEGTFAADENTFPLKPAHKELLQAGELYINIASGEYRRGELRGQIPPLGK